MRRNRGAAVRLRKPLRFFARLGEMIYQQIAGVGGSESVPRAQVVGVPYATLGVRLGSSAEAMFVLESRSGAALQRVGGSEFAISTREWPNSSHRRDSSTTSPGFWTKRHSPGKRFNPLMSRDYRYDLADLNAWMA